MQASKQVNAVSECLYANQAKRMDSVCGRYHALSLAVSCNEIPGLRKGFVPVYAACMCLSKTKYLLIQSSMVGHTAVGIDSWICMGSMGHAMGRYGVYETCVIQ